ncbi:hypothetical protein ABIG06_001463 [Bradyrhizobium sp. USDA 326]|uniref:S1/P1 nuclease n=1 Tax=Bradyrhizobium sp. USDA 326 TaxID=3377726 RepID=UPI003C721F36
MRLLFLVAIALLVQNDRVLAWGQEGHSIVAEIAAHCLDQTTYDSIRALLKTDLLPDVQDGHVSLGSIASWADDYRAEHEESRNWHFVNIPFERGTYDPQVDCRPDSRYGDCIINAIERQRVTLADCEKSPAERTAALKFIVHFVGDIHQPLHASERNGDHGGNDVVVSFFGKSAKLHAVWDTDIILRTVYAWGAYVTRLETKWLPGRDLSGLDGGTPVDWALESHKFARDVVYDIPDGAVLEMNYYSRALPVVDRQLALAGLRLAQLLKDTLKPTASCP